MTGFGDFKPICSRSPSSYPWCNLFYRQIAHHSPQTFNANSTSPHSAPVGVNPTCAIPRAGAESSIGNIANVIACALSMILVAGLIVLTSRRKAAVGRVELRLFLSLYFLTLPFQILTTGSFLAQGSTTLVVLTAIHAGLVVALFWGLLANALVATQVVEDGTASSLIPYAFFTLAFFTATTYISLDIALTISHVFGPSNPLDALHSIPLFVLTSIWPGVASLLTLAVMTYIVLAILNETRPMWYYLLAAILFVLSQLAFFLLGKVICNGSKQRLDGSFIATILETAAVVVLYLAWKSITEESWEEDYYPS